VELSRRDFQGRDVVELEQLWGDHLVAQKNPDAAINHYTEAGAYVKAIEAAISCRQMTKAAQIVETLDAADAKPYYAQLARHFETVRAYDDAERFFLRAGLPQVRLRLRLRLRLGLRALPLNPTPNPIPKPQPKPACRRTWWRCTRAATSGRRLTASPRST